MELMEGSIRTCSFSLREMCKGLRIISVDVLDVSIRIARDLLCFYFGDVVSFHDLAGEVL